MLTEAMDATGLSLRELWVRYFEIGGNAAALEIDAFLHGALELSRLERDRFAHAINERFMELNSDRRVAYLGPERP